MMMIFKGEEKWNKKNKLSSSYLYNWSSKSTYIKKPPFFDNMIPKEKKIENILNAKALAVLGNSTVR